MIKPAAGAWPRLVMMISKVTWLPTAAWAGPRTSTLIVGAVTAAAMTVVVAQSLRLQAAGGCHFRAVGDASLLDRAEVQLDGLLLTRRQLTETPLESLADGFGRRSAAQIAEVFRHFIGQHDVSERRVAGVGDLDAVGDGGPDGRPSWGPSSARQCLPRSRSSGCCRCRQPVGGPPGPCGRMTWMVMLLVPRAGCGWNISTLAWPAALVIASATRVPAGAKPAGGPPIIS